MTNILEAEKVRIGQIADVSDGHDAFHRKGVSQPCWQLNLMEECCV